jgi:hypothetical protein
MKNIEEVREAFARLPERVTSAQIAEATGRSHIHNWTPDPTFPGEVDRKGRTIYRDRDAVLDWYVEQPFARTDRSGPRDLHSTVLSVQPTRVLLDSGELGDLLGLTRRAVNKYADRYPAGEVADPFPPTDYDGKRSWSQVRAWLLRKSDPIPQPGEGGDRVWAEVRVWLLRHATDGSEPHAGKVYLDELGLTVGQRDVIERSRIARASGTEVPSEWLAEVLHLQGPGQAEWLAELLDLEDAGRVTLLAQDTAPPEQEPRRLRPTALARELGIDIEKIKHFVRTYTPDKTDDPFPAKDSSSARDLAEVRDWLIRNRKVRPAQEAPADA